MANCISPKNLFTGIDAVEDCNFDLALLRWGCQTLLESAKRLEHSGSPDGNLAKCS